MLRKLNVKPSVPQHVGKCEEKNCTGSALGGSEGKDVNNELSVGLKELTFIQKLFLHFLLTAATHRWRGERDLGTQHYM